MLFLRSIHFWGGFFSMSLGTHKLHFQGLYISYKSYGYNMLELPTFWGLKHWFWGPKVGIQ